MNEFDCYFILIFFIIIALFVYDVAKNDNEYFVAPATLSTAGVDALNSGEEGGNSGDNGDNDNTNTNNIYIINKKFNKGDYLYDYQCKKNVHERDCLDACSNIPNCVAVEYNPIYIDKNTKTKEQLLDYGICCLKKSIGDFVERDDKYENGQFYIKTKLNNPGKKILICAEK
jgi:hypothetical protein